MTESAYINSITGNRNACDFPSFKYEYIFKHLLVDIFYRRAINRNLRKSVFIFKYDHLKN